RRAAELQHLHEQIAKGLEMAAAELGDGAEIGPVHRRHRHEIQPLFAGLRQSSRGIDAAAVAVEQQRHHQRRMKRRKAALLFVAIKDSAQIEIVAHGVANEMRDVPCRHEISQRRRQNPGLIDVPRTESLAHPPTESRFALYVEQIRPLQGRAPSTLRDFKSVAAAAGGRFGRLDGGPDMIDLAAIAMLSRLRGEQGVRKYADEHNLTDNAKTFASALLPKPGDKK